MRAATSWMKLQLLMTKNKGEDINLDQTNIALFSGDTQFEPINLNKLEIIMIQRIKNGKW
jgi:hypothetical protein